MRRVFDMQRSAARRLARHVVWLLAVTALAPALAQDSDSDSVSDSDVFDCGKVGFLGGGTYTWSYSAQLEATVTPYITDDRDGEFTATVNVSTSHVSNCKFPSVASLARPQIYFGGGGGDVKAGWDADNAFRGSSVRLTNSGDRFLAGTTYRVAGNDGAGSFSFSPSVSVAGVGLSISQSDGAPIVLFGDSSNPRRIEIGNVMWGLFQYRGNFRDGGNFALQDFKLRTSSDSEAEFGTIDITIPVLKANEGVGVLTWTGQSVGTLSASVRYIRGNNLREPEIEIVPERDLIAPGETVKVDVIIRNRSTLSLNGGQVVLDTAALAPTLFPSTGSLNFDNIPPNGSRTVSFELTGFSEGRAPIEVEVRGGWVSPVPQDREYTRALSATDGIRVAEDNGPGNGAAALESPPPGSFESGVGLIRGWVCEAETVEIQLNDLPRLPVAYGTSREDTADTCGRADTGFGLTVNWNLLGDGTHTIRAFADGEQFGEATFTVTTLGVEFLRDASGRFVLEDFPDTGRDVTVRWSQAHQNFVISGDSGRAAVSRSANTVPATDDRARLDSPRSGALVGGIGQVRGWVCEADAVEIRIDDQPYRQLAHGIPRPDTAAACGDVDNGFDLSINWDQFEPGTHTVEVFADGVAFARSVFTVTDRSARALLPRNTSPAALESPPPGSFESGVGLIRGWVCEAETVEIQLNDLPRLPVAYGTSREDTAATCGRADTGFGLTVNWNLLGDGTHTIRAFADGEQFGQATFTVTTLGVEFLREADGEYDVTDFPESGSGVRLRWSQAHQNFVIIEQFSSLPTPPTAP